MKLYRYLYYKLYCIWLRKKDKPEDAHINAVITITFLIYVNIISIPLVWLAAFKSEVINLPEVNTEVKIWIVGLLVVTGLLNYFILARKKKHEVIVEEYNKESDKQRKKGLSYTWLYIVISLGIPLYIFFFTTPI